MPIKAAEAFLAIKLRSYYGSHLLRFLNLMGRLGSRWGNIVFYLSEYSSESVDVKDGDSSMYAETARSARLWQNANVFRVRERLFST